MNKDHNDRRALAEDILNKLVFDEDEPDWNFSNLKELESVAGGLGGSPSWKPIATAPKDGTPILTFQWLVDDLQDIDNYWISDWDTETKQWSGCPNPTHWQPLQPPEGLQCS